MQVLENGYETSDQNKPDYIGLHADDERELLPDLPIVSLTWCTGLLKDYEQVLPFPTVEQVTPHCRRFRLVPKVRCHPRRFA